MEKIGEGEDEVTRGQFFRQRFIMTTLTSQRKRKNRSPQILFSPYFFFLPFSTSALNNLQSLNPLGYKHYTIPMEKEIKNEREAADSRYCHHRNS